MRGPAHPQDFDDLTEGDADVRVVLDSSPPKGYEPGIPKSSATLEHDVVLKQPW